MPDPAFLVGNGLWLAGGLALVALALCVDHVLFRRRVDGAVEEMRARDDLARRAPVFDIDVEDDWAGFA